MLVSTSTLFEPYVLEVLIIPIAIVLGTFSAWISRKVIAGPLIYITVTISFYLWVLIYFYSSDTSAFFTVHMNNFDSYKIDIIFIIITWLLSWIMVKTRRLSL